MRGMTKKPCPGCGSVDGRPVDAVCCDCRHALAEWAKHVAHVNAEHHKTTVQLSEYCHWDPGFYYGGPGFRMDGFDETRDGLRKLFHELGELVAGETLAWTDAQDEGVQRLYVKPDVRWPRVRGEDYAKRAEYPTGDGEQSSRGRFAKIDTRTLDTLRALWDHAARYAEMSYLGGVHDGRNFLLQLSSGQMSADQFAEKDMKLAARIQNAEYLHEKLKRKKK